MNLGQLKQLDWPMWAARLLSLPAILFVGAEVLFPHGGTGEVDWQDWILLGLIVAATIGLVIAWRWVRMGGLIAMSGYLLHLALWPFLRSGFAPTWWMLGLFIGIPGLVFWWLSRRK